MFFKFYIFLYWLNNTLSALKYLLIVIDNWDRNELFCVTSPINYKLFGWYKKIYIKFKKKLSQSFFFYNYKKVIDLINNVWRSQLLC